MYIRTVTGPDRGGIIEIRRGPSPSRFHLIHPKESIKSLEWVDKGHVIMLTSDDQLLFVEISSGAILSRVKHEGERSFVIAPDRKSFWTTGGHLCHYSLPDLRLINRYYGISRSDDGDWRLITDPTDVPPAFEQNSRYVDDFRAFPFMPTHWTALPDNMLVGTAPHQGKHSDDKRFQGTDFIRIDTQSGAVMVKPLPGTARSLSRDILSISPDGCYALRAHPEPIANGPLKEKLTPNGDKPSLLRKLFGSNRKQDYLQTLRRRGHKILAEDKITKNNRVPQICYPLELWDVRTEPTLLGLIVSEWLGTESHPRYGDEFNSELHGDLPEIFADMSNSSLNTHADSYRAATCFGLSAEAWFEQISVLNDLDTALLGDVLEQEPDHQNIEAIQTLSKTVNDKFKLRATPPLWIPGDQTWQFLTICQNGALAQVASNGTVERVELPRPNEVNASQFDHPNISRIHSGASKSRFFDRPETAAISLDPFGKILLATASSRILLAPYHAGNVLQVPLWQQMEADAWTYAYSSLEDKTEERRITKDLVDVARFGVVSVTGSTEKHYVSALSRLLKLFKNDSSRLVHDGSYDPQFKRDGLIFGETLLCKEIADNGFVGCIPALDKLITASANFHGDELLSVFHPDNQTHTCAPMVFARFKLAGAFGDAALNWLYGHDAGHEHYCLASMNDSAELAQQFPEDFMTAAVVLFWNEYFDGNVDDARQEPYFRAALAANAEHLFKDCLEDTLREQIRRKENLEWRLVKIARNNLETAELDDAVAFVVDWANARSSHS